MINILTNQPRFLCCIRLLWENRRICLFIVHLHASDNLKSFACSDVSESRHCSRLFAYEFHLQFVWPLANVHRIKPHSDHCCSVVFVVLFGGCSDLKRDHSQSIIQNLHAPAYTRSRKLAFYLLCIYQTVYQTCKRKRHNFP